MQAYARWNGFFWHLFFGHFILKIDLLQWVQIKIGLAKESREGCLRTAFVQRE